MQRPLALLVLLAAACNRFAGPPRATLALAPAVEFGPYRGQHAGLGGRVLVLIPFENLFAFGAMVEDVRYGDRDAQLFLGFFRFDAADPDYGHFYVDVGLGDGRYPDEPVENPSARLEVAFARPLAPWLDWETSVSATFITIVVFDSPGVPVLPVGLSTGLALRF